MENARLLLWEEFENYLGEPVFIEFKGNETCREDEYWDIVREVICGHFISTLGLYMRRDYNKRLMYIEWRAWTSRPTTTQKQAKEWMQCEEFRAGTGLLQKI